MSMDPSSPRTANADPAVPGAEEEPPLLVLASRSPGRARILTDAGIDFEAIVSDVDEDAAVAEAVERLGGSLDAPSMALLLARTKAESVAALDAADGAVVLGCDSVFELDGVSYGKPPTAEVAIERWKAMRGKTGVLHTGHWLVDNRSTEEDDGGTGAALGTVASASVSFDEVTDEEIEAYVATGEPLPCAGAFTIDGRGAAFITGIDGDPHTVVGLSVNTLRHLLVSAELSITDLWG
ncbi:Maf family protein [Arthrobacter rhombi]|uniref:Maf family protein n=1 Tax=Arthrobacter rhombi TaxID=71253 RepID=UPI003FCEE80A